MAYAPMDLPIDKTTTQITLNSTVIGLSTKGGFRAAIALDYMG
jgi:hypothetical protein